MPRASCGSVRARPQAESDAVAAILLFWEDGCYYLRARAKLTFGKFEGHRGHFYREADVDRIAKAFKKAKEFHDNPPEVITWRGQECYSTPKAMEYTGQSINWLRQHVKAIHRNKNGRLKGLAYYPKTWLTPRDERAPLLKRPTDLDRILVAQAAELVNCCEQTIRNIAKNDPHRLRLQNETLEDTLGRPSAQTTLSKRALRSLFVYRPPPGKPIILPADEDRSASEQWYLRDDAIQRLRQRGIECTELTLYRYFKRESVRFPGLPALRRTKFYVIGEKSRANPKKQVAYNGKDLDAIAAGKENAGLRPNTRSLYAQSQHRKVRDEITAFFHELIKIMPVLRSDAIYLATSCRGFKLETVYKVKNDLEVESKHTDVAGNPTEESWWGKAWDEPPTAEDAPRHTDAYRATKEYKQLQAKPQDQDQVSPRTVADRPPVGGAPAGVRGRKISPENEKIYAACFVVRPNIFESKLRTADAIKVIELVHGPTALGSRNADYDTKSRRFRLNADWFKKHLIAAANNRTELDRLQKLVSEQTRKVQESLDFLGGEGIDGNSFPLPSLTHQHCTF